MHPETAKSLWDEATKRIEWLEKGLKEIIHCSEIRDNYGMIEDIAKSLLNGEPTTADEMNKAIKETPEYKAGKNIMKIYQFGGDTGIDADYYDENSEKFLKVSK